MGTETIAVRRIGLKSVVLKWDGSQKLENYFIIN